MPFFKNKFLRKAFLAAAAVTSFAALAPAPAQAYPVAVHVATTSAATSAAAAAAAAANARHNREAQNDVIVNPSDEHIAHLRGRGLVDGYMVPYIRETVAEMHIAPGTRPDSITEAQRDHFMRVVREKQLVAEMSSNTADEAVSKGMSKSLTPYFVQCKTELGYSGPVTLAEAQSIEARAEHMHWELDTKPALEKGGLILGGLAAAGGIGFALARKRNGNGYGY